MKRNLPLALFYLSAATVVAILFFFILYNAQWLVGDDAIVIRHTGWGHPFKIKDTISPSTGRFFPFAYLIYNLLWLLGLNSLQAHFLLVAVVFLLSCLMLVKLGFTSVGKSISVSKYVIVFAFLLIGIQRIYVNHLDQYSTFWVDYAVVLLFCITCYYVHVKQSIAASVFGFIFVSFLCYCIEVAFLIPLCYGTAGLLFSWRTSSKLEKAFLFSLVCTALLFLMLYAIIVLPYIENAYSGDHGECVSFLGNAFKQLLAQKILWLGLVAVCYRAYMMLVKKEPYEFLDSMILAGFGYCVGCAILKLNWVLYYSSASLFMLPAIVRYMSKYIGVKWTAIILSSLALFMCRKIPHTIIENQNDRKRTTEMMTLLCSNYANGETVFWFEPNDNRPWSFDLEMRAWVKSSLQTQIGWTVGEEYFKLNIIEDFTRSKGLYVLPSQNNILFPGYNDKIVEKGNIIWNSDNMRSFIIVRIDD